MKSNEQQSPVDEYFRQRENEIPVAFNPDDWGRLAAMLDAAEKTDAPGLPQAPAEKSPPGRKGWWVSGVWILALVTVCWVAWQMAGHSAGTPAPAAAETGPKEYLKMPEEEKKATPEREKAGKTNRTSGTGSAGETSETPVPLTATESETLAPAAPDMPAQAADSMSFRKLPVQPADSAATPVKPEKKKKHLFW